MQTWTNLLWAKQSEYFKCTKRITNNNSITGLSSTNLYNYTNNQTIQTLCHSTTNLCTAYITNKLEKGKEEMELYTHNHHPPHPLSPSAHLWGVLCTPYNHVPVYSTILFKATWIHWVHVCSAVTCHLHFGQNDQDLLPTTVVTQGWNGYWSKSQHKKFTLERKILLLPPPGL